MEKLSIYNLWLSFQSTVNTFQGGWFRPQTDFQQKANDISSDLFVEYTNQAERSQKARDALYFLLKTENVMCSKSSSNFSIALPPKRYERFAGMSILYHNEKTYADPDINGGKFCDANGEEQEKITDEYLTSLKRRTVELVDNMRWNACLEHKTKMPTFDNPKTTFINEQFRVAPRGIGAIVLDFYVKPEDAVFAYTVTAGDRNTGAGQQIVFDKNKSNDLPWPTTLKNEFIIRLGEAYGLFTRDQFVTNFSTQQKMM